MGNEYSQYLHEINPVAKGKKSFRLLESSLGRVVFGFEASKTEVIDFYTLIYEWGSHYMKMMLKHSKSCESDRIVLLAENVGNPDEGIVLQGSFRGFDVESFGLASDGEIVSISPLDLLSSAEDLFAYIGIDLVEDAVTLHPMVVEFYFFG